MTAKPEAAAAKIFSSVLNVADIPEDGLDVSIAADRAVLQALAAADGIESIAYLEAAFHIVPSGSESFNVSGEMRAKITQICVVSLEPFETEVIEPIDVDFAPQAAAKAMVAKARAGKAKAGAGAIIDVVEDRDPPDPLIDGKIDLGVLAAEFLALGLDPYPKKPGARFDPPAGPSSDAEDTPFSVLGTLRTRG